LNLQYGMFKSVRGPPAPTVHSDRKSFLMRLQGLLGIFVFLGIAWAITRPLGMAARRGNIPCLARLDEKTAKAQREELLIGYQKAINSAFHDVSDALVGYQKTKEYTSSVNVLAATLRDQSMLANARYVGGVSSYLEVLDTERQRLTAEQQLAQADRDVLTALVQLYKALGGGWQ
jgi:hypothetical protein